MSIPTHRPNVSARLDCQIFFSLSRMPLLKPFCFKDALRFERGYKLTKSTTTYASSFFTFLKVFLKL